MSDHRHDVLSQSHEDEKKRALKDLRLVQAWQEQHLPVFIPLKANAETTEWVSATIKGWSRRHSTPKTKTDVFVTVIFGDLEATKRSIPLSELIALQDQHFLDQASGLIGEIIQNSHTWISLSDASNDLTGSDHYSVQETDTPPTKHEIQEQVDTIMTGYRQDLFLRNRSYPGMPSYHDEVPLLLRTMNSWSHGLGSPGETGIGLRKSAFPHWRDEDFSEVCRRAELAFEETRLSILLQEILLYGVESKKLPPAVSSETYGEFLLYLQRTAGKRRLPQTDQEEGASPSENVLDLQMRLSLVESWRSQHAAIHLKLRATDPTWIEGDWVEETTTKDDPRDPLEKGVAIAFQAEATETHPSKDYQKMMRLSQLIRFQDDYFVEQARDEFRHLREPHHWLTKAGREAIDVSGTTHSVKESDFPPTEGEKRDVLKEAIVAYRNYAFARHGLIKRIHPPGTRSLRPAPLSFPEPVRSSFPPGTPLSEPEIIHHWNAWSAGIAASEGPYKDYRELNQPWWSDADYAELCMRIQREIWVTDASAMLQKIQRFGVSSVDLPHTVSPEAFIRVIQGLESLTVLTK